ncbi:MAG: Yip1 family protein [Pseudomonadota bacterium]
MSDNTFNLATVIDDAKKVITDPAGFYREMPTEGGYTNPVIFVAVMAAVTGILGAVFSVIGFGGNAIMAGAAGFAAIIIMPIAMVIFSFIGAAILFVIWKLMGSEKDYEVAYRCAAYCTAILPIVTLLSLIPYVGTIIQSIWAFFLITTASVEVHKLPAQTSKIVFGVILGLLLLFSLSAENTARKWEKKAKKWEQAAGGAAVNMENMLEDVDDMTAEEAGEKFGEFLKGMEKAARELEEAEKEKND